MRFEFIFLLFTVTIAHAQSASFKEIKLRPNPEYFNPTDKYPTIFYPVVSTKKPAIDKLINDEIRQQVLDSDEPNPDLRKILTALKNDGLTDLSYEITFNKNNILSFSIYTQYSGGAHLSDNTTYFNFDLSTGKKIGLSNLLVRNKLDPFKQKIISDRRDSLTKYKLDELDLLKQNEIDSTTYELAIEQIGNNDSPSPDFESFIIFKDGIEVIDKFEFPSVIRSQEPTYHLKYALRSLAVFLNSMYRDRLLK